MGNGGSTAQALIWDTNDVLDSSLDLHSNLLSFYFHTLARKEKETGKLLSS